MAKKLILLVTLIAAMAQVACSNSDDDKQADAAAQQCLQNNTCGMYTNAVKAVAGNAAVNGLPQVAAATQSPQQGQVPNTSVLPASIQAQAQQIQAKLKALQAQAAAASAAAGGPIQLAPAAASTDQRDPASVDSRADVSNPASDSSSPAAR